MHNIALLVATKRLNFKPRLSHQDNSSLCPLQGNVNCCMYLAVHPAPTCVIYVSTHYYKTNLCYSTEPTSCYGRETTGGT